MSFLPVVSPRSLADWIGDLVGDAAAAASRPLAHAVASMALHAHCPPAPLSLSPVGGTIPAEEAQC